VKKLSQLLLKSFIGPFLVTFLVTMFMFVMQFLWKYVDDMMGKGIEIHVILELLIYASARLVNLSLPLAILLSSIMTFGALAENYELAAMKSCGLSLLRIMRPLIVFMTIFALGAFLFANNVWPIANLKFKSLLYSIIQQRPALNLTDGVFYNGIEGISMRVAHKNEETNELTDVLIYDHREKYKGNRTVIRAERGQMQQTEDKRFLVLTLFDGHSYDEQTAPTGPQPGYPSITNHFEKAILRIDLSGFEFGKTDEELFRNSYEMMTLGQLDFAIDSIENRVDQRKVDIQKYIKKNLYITRDSIRFDKYSDSLKVLPDSVTNRKFFFERLTPSQRNRALEQAQDLSRGAKGYIERVQKDMEGKLSYVNKHKIEWHRKLFLAFACIVLFFIGAPLGAIIRKGGLGLPTVVALGFFIVYHVLTIIGEKLVREDVLEPVVGMWMSSIILFPLGVFLTYKAATDSTLLDREAYTKFIDKVFRKKKKIGE
jgi:lipopolysaccharide export system permease protein